jgi:histidyl-tRNA synthetase
LLPKHHKYLTFLKKVFRHEFRKNWFRRISTDILENGKFRSKSELWILNAYINNYCNEQIQPIYYYYMDHFLSEDWGQDERIWWEIIWEHDPIIDAISIFMTYISLNKIWLKDTFHISINSIWIEKEQLKYKEDLLSYLENSKNVLTEETVWLLDNDIFNIFSTKNEDEKILLENAPKIKDYFKKDSKKYYNSFIEFLEILGVPYTQNDLLFPKNNYNSHWVWSFDFNDWSNVCFGARYNKLAQDIWSKKEIPATGFSINTSLVISKMLENEIELVNKDKIDVFFVWLWDDAKKILLPLSIKSREAWINTVMSLGTPSMKEQILKANRSWAKFLVLVGFMEAKTWVFQVRNLEEWIQFEVKKEDLLDFIIEKVWKQNLDFYNPAKDLIIK